MSSSAVLTSVRRLRSLMAVQQGGDNSDEQLLTAFADRRDEVAFATLVRRHGPMVLGVCRRVLGHEQDAEDAFQATFLVLAQRVASLRNHSALSSFLHGTAFHLASKVKRAAGRRHKYEGQAPPRSSADPTHELSWREVRSLLDEEVARLPEKYRRVFVLCCLEELTQAEAGQRLGLKAGTVASRLTQARKRLSQRLARRGVELTAALATIGLATQSASALPAGLMASTIKGAMATTAGEGLAGVVSASVVELVQGAPTMMASKAKIVAVLLLAMTLAAGAGVWTCYTRTTPSSDEPQTEAPASPSPSAQGQKAETPQKEKGDSITVTGRVVGPDDMPIEGARLYWPRIPKVEPRSEEDIEFPQRARTNADGGFRFELPRSDVRPEWNISLVAVADGYGVDGVELPKDGPPADLVLRLVKDQPIEGRVVNTEGKPLAGVRVRALEISAPSKGRMDDFLNAWKQEWHIASGQLPRHLYLPPLPDKSAQLVTDKEGRFRINGAGVERLVKLRLSGKGVGQDALHVITRPGFDATALNKAVLERIPAELRLPGQPPLLYGPTITYVAPSSRRIEGTVREAGTGKPVAGITVHCGTGYGDALNSVSDKEGHYKLEGVPKMKQYLLNAWPQEGSPWLSTGARRNDEEGFGPFQIDFTLARGVVVSGRVIDRKTGKGVRGGIRYVPLPGNPFAGKPGYDFYNYDRTMRTVNADGRFKMPVMPGPGVVMVQASGTEKTNGGQELCPYKQAEFDDKDREHVKPTENGEDRLFTSLGNSLEFLSGENAVKYLDLAPDAAATECNLYVERGETQTVRIEDPEGKPLAGTTVAGVTAKWPIVYPVKDATFTVFALDPKKPRKLFFLHVERKLGGTLTVRGDEKESLSVRLAPVGAVTGQVLDREGQPIAGAFVDLNSPDGTMRELTRQLKQLQPTIRTDKEGRFRLEGIVPNVPIMLSIYQGRTFLVGEPKIGTKQVKPGQTLDLGAVRVKPG